MQRKLKPQQNITILHDLSINLSIRLYLVCLHRKPSLQIFYLIFYLINYLFIYSQFSRYNSILYILHSIIVILRNFESKAINISNFDISNFTVKYKVLRKKEYNASIPAEHVNYVLVDDNLSHFMYMFDCFGDPFCVKI